MPILILRLSRLSYNSPDCFVVCMDVVIVDYITLPKHRNVCAPIRKLQLGNQLPCSQVHIPGSKYSTPLRLLRYLSSLEALV